MILTNESRVAVSRTNPNYIILLKELKPEIQQQILKNQEDVKKLQSENQSLKYERVDLLNKFNLFKEDAEKFNYFKQHHESKNAIKNEKIIERLDEEIKNTDGSDRCMCGDCESHLQTLQQIRRGRNNG